MTESPGTSRERRAGKSFALTGIATYSPRMTHVAEDLARGRPLACRGGRRLLLAGAAGLLLLAGCGRKGELEVPPEEPAPPSGAPAPEAAP